MSEQRSRTWLWAVLAIAALFLLIFGGLIVLGTVAVRGGINDNRDSVVEQHGSSGSIGVVDLEGVILTSKDFLSQINRYYDDDSVKAIVIRINSPGGGAAASQEIYSEIQHLKQRKKKPIISTIETVGASGAYYVASATDKIYANSASVVGSIGVIAEWVNYGDLMKWAKLKPVVLSAGALKDAGDPSRDLTPEERAYMQGLVDNMYTQFVRDVASGRSSTPAIIKPLATGQVWTGEQALPLKLIDGIATYREVIEQTGKQVGLGDRPTIITPAKPRRSIMTLLFGDASDLLPDPKAALHSDIGFYYLWGR